MYNKLIVCFVFFTSLAMLTKSQPLQQVISKEQVIKMIPRSHDMLDLPERENLLKLISEVDSIYPILCEELLVSENPRTQAYILAILGKSKESKELVLPAIREYMNRHKDDDPQLDSMFTGIKALGEIGRPEDAELLSKFLNIGFESSRVVAAQSIEQIRTREQARERDAERLKRNSKKGEIENSENLNSRSSTRPVSELTGADKPQMNSVRIWPWTLGALVLIVAMLILKYRKNISS